MLNQLIELEDGLLVEVEAPQDQVNQIAGGMPEQVDKAIDTVRPMLLKACRPVVPRSVRACCSKPGSCRRLFAKC